MSVPPKYAYHLVIEYPPEGVPVGWCDEESRTSPRAMRWEDAYGLDGEFIRDEHNRVRYRWPRERAYLSLSAASDRATHLRELGCDVKIQRSAPIQWSLDGGSSYPDHLSAHRRTMNRRREEILGRYRKMS